MRTHRVTVAGQVSLPAEIRRRWRTSRVLVEDLGDSVIIRPLPDDPIAAARGALRGKVDSTALREKARADEGRSERRR